LRGANACRADRDWRIAVHEAGHVVVARVLGLPGCGEASVIEPNAHAVFCLDHGPPSICALFAGAAAEIELIGEPPAEKPAGRVWPQNVARTPKEMKEKLASIRDKK
jgi:hypothetical protein